jgi:hypothetical protein
LNELRDRKRIEEIKYLIEEREIEEEKFERELIERTIRK